MSHSRGNQLACDAKHAWVVQYEGTEFEVETCCCPLCGNHLTGPTRYGRGPFGVHRCGACGLWYMSPRPTASSLATIYQSDKYFGGDRFGYSDYRSQEPALRKTFRKVLAQLHQLGVTGGSLLEVGAGMGFLLDEAHPYFQTRTGIELSAEAARVASETAGSPVLTDLENIPAGECFDCIIATHVVEHITSPVTFATSLAERLSPEGVLVLAAPDMGSPLRHLMGNHWPSFKYPEHLSYFDKTTLPLVLTQAGLVGIRKLAYPHAFPVNLILSKFGITPPASLGQINITIPTTTVCFAGYKGDK